MLERTHTRSNPSLAEFNFSTRNQLIQSPGLIDPRRMSLPVHHTQYSPIGTSPTLPEQSGQRKEALHYIDDVCMKVNELKERSEAKRIDEAGYILEYTSKDFCLLSVQHPNCYNEARKQDLMRYGSLLFRIAQRLLLEGFNELNEAEPDQVQKLYYKKIISEGIGKRAVADMERIHLVFQRIVSIPHITKYTIGFDTLAAPINSDAVKKSKDLVESYKHRLLTVIMQSQAELVHKACSFYTPTLQETMLIKEPNDRFMIRYAHFESLSYSCQFFKFKNINDLHKIGLLSCLRLRTVRSVQKDHEFKSCCFLVMVTMQKFKIQNHLQFNFP
ncbi:hypothetical protein AKO1_004467, partial [Acrasis kona]